MSLASLIWALQSRVTASQACSIAVLTSSSAMTKPLSTHKTARRSGEKPQIAAAVSTKSAAAR